jgi:HK97 family phage major capsid protein
MNKIKLFKRPQLRFEVGLRLFLVALVLTLGILAKEMLGAMVLAGIIALFPGRKRVPGVLAMAMTAEEELAEMKLLQKIEAKSKAMIEAAMKGSLTEAQLEAKIKELNKEIKELNDSEVKALKKSIDEYTAANGELQKKLEAVEKAMDVQSAALKKMADNAGPNGGEKPKSFKALVREAVFEKKDILKTINDENGERFSMKDYFNGSSDKRVSFTIKAPVDMLQSNIVGTGVNEYYLTEADPTRVSIPLAVYPHVTDVFSIKNMTKPYMALLVVYEYEDGAATKVEGSASGKSSFKFQTVLFKAFYIATHFKISDETLDDIDEVIDEIGIVGPDKVLSAVDTKVLGTTGDDITDIKGIRTTGVGGKSTLFVAATVPDTPDAKFADLVMAMRLQAENAGYRANVVMINPQQEYLLGAEKNTIEDSRQDRRIAFDSLGRPSFIGGLRIIVNSGVPANQALVLDNKLTWIGRRKDMTMEIGYDGNDLTEGMKTVVIKIRLAFGVRDKAGVIWASIVDNAIAQITAS